MDATVDVLVGAGYFITAIAPHRYGPRVKGCHAVLVMDGTVGGGRTFM